MLKSVFLTIDDGPSALTPVLAEFLQCRGVPAVFFFLGQRMEALPDAVDDALRRGFTVGNHGFSHAAFSSLTFSDAIREIEATERLIEAAHARTGRPRRRKVFRFPYGDKGGALKSRLQNELAKRGFEPVPARINYDWYRDEGLSFDRDWYWTVDTQDYRLAAEPGVFVPAHVLNRLKDSHPASGGSLVTGDSDEVVLMHDHEATEKLWPEYVREIVSAIERSGAKWAAF